MAAHDFATVHRAGAAFVGPLKQVLAQAFWPCLKLWPLSAARHQTGTCLFPPGDAARSRLDRDSGAERQPSHLRGRAIGNAVAQGISTRESLLADAGGALRTRCGMGTRGRPYFLWVACPRVSAARPPGRHGDVPLKQFSCSRRKRLSAQYSGSASPRDRFVDPEAAARWTEQMSARCS